MASLSVTETANRQVTRQIPPREAAPIGLYLLRKTCWRSSRFALERNERRGVKIEGKERLPFECFNDYFWALLSTDGEPPTA